MVKEPTDESAKARTEFRGPVTIKADQVHIGNHGKQDIAYQIGGKEVARFFADLQAMVTERGASAEATETLIREIRKLREVLGAENPEPAEVGERVSRLKELAPWIKEKLEQLTVGALGSMLGSGIVAAVKTALGIS